MEKCPICEKSLAGDVCQHCGYDASLDYEKYPTVTKIPFTIKRHHTTQVIYLLPEHTESRKPFSSDSERMPLTSNTPTYAPKQQVTNYCHEAGADSTIPPQPSKIPGSANGISLLKNIFIGIAVAVLSVMVLTFLLNPKQSSNQISNTNSSNDQDKLISLEEYELTSGGIEEHAVLPQDYSEEKLVYGDTVTGSLLYDTDIRKKINIFLSNFAEQQFVGYPVTDDYYLLQFAYIYSQINSPGLITYSGNSAYMSKSDVDMLLNNFFGRTVIPSDDSMLFCHPENPQWTIAYGAGEYEFIAAAGEYRGYVAVACNVIAIADGEYEVPFNIYEIAYDSADKDYYDITDEEAVCTDELTLNEQGIAIVKEYTRPDGKETYQLLRYEILH